VSVLGGFGNFVTLVTPCYIWGVTKVGEKACLVTLVTPPLRGVTCNTLACHWCLQKTDKQKCLLEKDVYVFKGSVSLKRKLKKTLSNR
jgi:hypothetical protein